MKNKSNLILLKYWAIADNIESVVLPLYCFFAFGVIVSIAMISYHYSTIHFSGTITILMVLITLLSFVLAIILSLLPKSKKVIGYLLLKSAIENEKIVSFPDKAIDILDEALDRIKNIIKLDK